MEMSFLQLEKFIKVFQQFNNEYTGDFIKFIQSNKNDVEIFRELNYTELTYVNKDAMRVLLDYKEEIKEKENLKLKNSMGKLDTHKEIHVLANDQIDQNKIQELPFDVQVKVKENMKIFYKPRRNMDYCRQTSSKRQFQNPLTYNNNEQA